MNFSENVTVDITGGTPTLALNDGATAAYTGGSGSNALTFSYTVAAGQNTADLAVTSLDLNGATINDGVGNSADLSGAATNPDGILQIDTLAPTAPVVSSIVPDTGSGSADELTNSTTVAVNGTADANSTVMLFNGATQVGTTSANGSGNWTVTNVVLSEGANNLTATTTDAAGNTSAASASYLATLDRGGRSTLS